MEPTFRSKNLDLPERESVSFERPYTISLEVEDQLISFYDSTSSTQLPIRYLK